MPQLDTQNVIVELSTGASIPLRPTTAKNGNVYHAVLGKKANGQTYVPRFGRRVAPSVVGGSLPEKVMVAGAAVAGEPGTTSSGYKKVSFAQRVEIDGQERNLYLSISKVSNDVYNVIGRLTRPGGGGASAVAVEL